MLIENCFIASDVLHFYCTLMRIFAVQCQLLRNICCHHCYYCYSMLTDGGFHAFKKSQSANLCPHKACIKKWIHPLFNKCQTARLCNDFVHKNPNQYVSSKFFCIYREISKTHYTEMEKLGLKIFKSAKVQHLHGIQSKYIY